MSNKNMNTEKIIAGKSIIMAVRLTGKGALSEHKFFIATKREEESQLNWVENSGMKFIGNLDNDLFETNMLLKMAQSETQGKGITNVMLNLFSQFGWKIKEGKEQIFGSCADIYAEQGSDEEGWHFMWIDDGNCHNELADAVYHIYCGRGALDLKIFEGRIGTPEDFTVVMKVLGFEKTN